MISIDDKKANVLSYGNELININKNNPKLIINYYDIIKAEVFIDLNLPIKEIIKNIFAQIFCPYLVKNRYERTKKNQTTKDIILNPIKDIYGKKVFSIMKIF